MNEHPWEWPIWKVVKLVKYPKVDPDPDLAPYNLEHSEEHSI
jgi:hypothetical protein